MRQLKWLFNKNFIYFVTVCFIQNLISVWQIKIKYYRAILNEYSKNVELHSRLNKFFCIVWHQCRCFGSMSKTATAIVRANNNNNNNGHSKRAVRRKQSKLCLRWCRLTVEQLSHNNNERRCDNTDSKTTQWNKRYIFIRIN